jgi:hypothetical protein
VDDLEFVSMFESRSFPLSTRYYLQVQLHGHAVGLHAELRHQAGHGQAVGEVALFAVDEEEHEGALGY